MSTPPGDRALQLESFFLPSGEQAHGPKPSTNWLELPEFPSADEILSEKPPELLFLPNENIKTKAEYAEKQYRIQRYEAVEPTRRAVNDFARQPLAPEGDAGYIYTNVQLRGVVLTKYGAATRVSFSTERAADDPVDWANSGRLRQGSLVVLSPIQDGFRSKCLVATVAYRFLAGGLWPDLEAEPPEPDDTPPRVDLYFSNWSEQLLDPTNKYYMLEAKNGYYEPFRHTMKALQTAAFEKSSLEKYVLPFDVTRLPKGKPVNIRKNTRNTLDKSQAAACESIISQELSIIQGPPGTGKTFTTVITIDEFIRQFNPTKPLIVAAQTNHALDQLLERCLAVGLTIGRLGGRSVSEKIEQFTLFNIREKNKGTVTGIRLSPGAYKEYEMAEQVLELHLKKATQGQNQYDARSFKDTNIISSQQLESLQNDD